MAGSLLIKLFVLALIGFRDGFCSNDDDQTQTDGSDLEIKIDEPKRPPPPRIDSQTLQNDTVVVNSPILPPPPKYESANMKTTRSETGNNEVVKKGEQSDPPQADKIVSTVAAIQQGQGQTQISTTVSDKTLKSDTQGKNNGTVERSASPKLSTIVMADASTTSTVKISTPSAVYVSALAENGKSTTKNLESGSLPKDKETDGTPDEEDSETNDDDADETNATDKDKADQKPDTNDGTPSTVLLQSKFSTQRVVTELASSTVLPSEPSEDEDDNKEPEEEDEEDDDYGTYSDSNETLAGARDEDENEDNNEDKGLNVGDDDDDEEDPDQEVEENEPDTSQKEENPEKSQVGKKNVVVEPQGSTHFMSYFLISVVFVACFYLVFHNRQKIKAYVLEGRNGRGGRRRKGGSDYHKLSTAEEVLPSLEKGIETKETYNY